jgi:LacI family transcriptional regulator
MTKEPAGPSASATRRRRASITIRDVARASNVSIGTASKALNNSGRLRRETREKVIAVAGELGFRANDLAHSLHRGQSLSVGLISTDAFGRFSIPIMEGIEECLSDSRIAVVMCNATDDPARETRHVEQLLGKRVDGVIVTARRTDIRPKLSIPSDIPVIYVFSTVDDQDACCVVPDDEGGARLATRHLVNLGRRRVAHVTGPERFQAVRLRRDGYLKTLAEAGLSVPEGCYLPGVWSEGWGREAVAELFGRRGQHPDALFCGSDQIARGVADALRESGVGVPDAVSLVGFDNWEIIADATRPPLTSVDMNLVELGREGGRRMLDLIAGRTRKGVEKLPCTLVVRQSCGFGRSRGVAGARD